MATVQTGIATSFIDFTRASNATVTDSDGLVKWAPHNLLTNSENFDAASWTKSNATIAANSAVAPNGTTTADKVYPTINGIGRGVNQRVLIDGPTNYSVSIYAKAAGKNFIAFTDLAAADFRAWVNLSTGAKTETAGYFVTVTSVGNGWYNCVFTQTATAANPYAYVVVCDADSSAAVTVNGTDGVHLWGAHLYRSDLGGMQPNTSAYPMYNPTTPKNLLGFTENFENAAWSKSNTAVTANAITAPNGLQTADLFVQTSGTTGGSIFQSSGPTWSSNSMVLFNLATGTVGTVTAGSFTSTSITSVGDGWYRCAAVKDGYTLSFYGKAGAWSSVALQTFSSEKMRLYPSTSSTAQTGTGDGTSGIYLWGAQLSDSASLDSYSPVYGAAVTSAAYYGPRRDFDPVTLACKGLLVEEQRVNLIRYSRTLETTASYWGGLASGTANTITIDNAPGPDGLSTSASMITYNTAVTGAGTYSAWRHTLSTTANGTYTFTIWLKAGTTSSVYLRFSDSGGNRANTLCTLTSSWQRFTVTGTTTASITTISCDVGADGNAGGQTLTAGTVYAYGAQLELGSFATSYVPNGSAVAGATRNADVASVSTQAFPYSATEGTLVANVSTFDTSSNLPTHINLSDGTTSNYIRMNAQPTSYKLRNYVRAGGADVVNSTIGGVTVVNDPFKAGVYYKTNSFNSSVNGAISTEVTTGAVPSAATTLSLGNWFVSAGTFLNGHIRQITYLPRRISNAELQTRTT